MQPTDLDAHFPKAFQCNRFPFMKSYIYGEQYLYTALGNWKVVCITFIYHMFNKETVAEYTSTIDALLLLVQ